MPYFITMDAYEESFTEQENFKLIKPDLVAQTIEMMAIKTELYKSWRDANDYQSVVTESLKSIEKSS